jgi:acyl-CoA synthetase (AMP-forming)/AMP-acid ligase II
MVRNAANPGMNFEKEAVTTVANGWEYLYFDYSTINTSQTYNRIVVIWELGTPGDGSANFTFLMDDFELVNSLPAPPLSLPLSFESTTTNFDWLNTKDRVEILGENTFKWMGRSDFTINSGGVKIQIEDIEAQICEQFQLSENDFCCWFEEDQALGQKLIMLLKKEIISSNSLANFEKQIKEKLGILAPKSIHLLDQLIFTESGKIDRRACFQYSRFC